MLGMGSLVEDFLDFLCLLIFCVLSWELFWEKFFDFTGLDR